MENLMTRVSRVILKGGREWGDWLSWLWTECLPFRAGLQSALMLLMLITTGDDWEPRLLRRANCNYKAKFLCGGSSLFESNQGICWSASSGWGRGARVQDWSHGSWLPGLLDWQSHNSAWLLCRREVGFTCTCTLSQEILFKAQMWRGSANVNWGLGDGGAATAQAK